MKPPVTPYDHLTVDEQRAQLLLGCTKNTLEKRVSLGEIRAVGGPANRRYCFTHIAFVASAIMAKGPQPSERVKNLSDVMDTLGINEDEVKALSTAGLLPFRDDNGWLSYRTEFVRFWRDGLLFFTESDPKAELRAAFAKAIIPVLSFGDDVPTAAPIIETPASGRETGDHPAVRRLPPGVIAESTGHRITRGSTVIN